ncbi:pirin family protein [Amphritea sp. 2_MG-2023]|uniref:pirin family protein n=1 Tax=Amphritea TaxID=515417 RepID=UPI001C0775FF|nr:MULTISPECIES: pirin family protein [Amphritea]MBU2965359.1 pirin family protein [Amphritea atlantica]MDO6420004.1 pirin family protein [Amphritea sp. 2_MG-2023]
MIRIKRASDRGYAHFGWLESRHVFSFGSYFDPDWMGISELRVANEDLLHPGAAIDPSTHVDMEVISVILDGKNLHTDSLGTRKLLESRSLQLLSTGTGTEFIEQNASLETTLKMLQFWIVPKKTGQTPRYQWRKLLSREGVQLIVSTDGRDDSLQIGQQAEMYQFRLQHKSYGLPTSEHGFLYLFRGQLEVNGSILEAGDAMLFDDEPMISLRGISRAEGFYFTLP